MKGKNQPGAEGAKNLQIKTLKKFHHHSTIKIPGSKSISHRVLILAALAEGTSVIQNISKCEDVNLTISALKQMGVEIWEKREGLFIKGTRGKFPLAPETIFLGDSGTAYRFFMAISALLPHAVVLESGSGMKRRPIGDLVHVLRLMGAEIEYLGKEGYPPIKIGKNGIRRLDGESLAISTDKSSQFFSALLLLAPLIPGGMKLHSEGVVRSYPYIEMTVELMRAFGVEVGLNTGENGNGSGKTKSILQVSANIPFQGGYLARTFQVEGDYSSASFFFTAAAIGGLEMVLTGLNYPSIQGDSYIIECLEQMGCSFSITSDIISIKGPNANADSDSKKLRPINADLSDYPDLVIPLSFAALFADDTSKFTNIEHLRLKESNRLELLFRYLTKLGAQVTLNESDLTIEPRDTYRGFCVDPCGDHRIAMGFSIAGLFIEGMQIKNPECVSKSFPNFYELLNSLYE